MTIIGEEMKPCPFCGSEPIFLEGGPDLVGIQCNSARCVNPHISNVSEAFARELWNTRSPEAVTVTPAMVEAGVKAMWLWDQDDDACMVVRSVYDAMRVAALSKVTVV